MPSRRNLEENDMTAKEYLSQPSALKKEIQDDIDNLADMRAIVQKVTTELSFTAGRVPSKDPHAFESMMLSITEAEAAILEKEEKLKELYLEVLAKINLVDNLNRRRLLKLRYIHEKTWCSIASDLYIGQRYVYDLHKMALRDFEEILKDRI